MSWRYVLADLNGRSVGEPQAHERTLSVGVSKVSTAAFRINVTDPLWNLVAAGEAMLRVYDSAGTLRFYGPVISDEEQADGQGLKVRVNAADLSWRLSRRYVGKDTSATPVGVTHTAKDSGQIVYDTLTAVNADEATGITAGTKDTFVARTVTFLWKRASDVVNEIGGITGSYEWALRYTDASPPTVQLDLKARLGQDRTASLYLEYGTGKSNCKSYRKARTIDQLLTDIYVRGSGTNLVTTAADAAARASYKRHEDVVDYSDITVAALLDALAAAHIAIRHRPRQMIDLTPFPKTAPKFGVDWNVGDTLTTRVVVNRQVRVNGAARIWGADITIDDQGNETATLHLSPE